MPPIGTQTTTGTPRARTPFMSVPSARRLLGDACSAEYLYRGLRENRFPGAAFGRSRMIRRDFVEAFLAANEAGLTISFDDFATQWMARESQAVAS